MSGQSTSAGVITQRFDRQCKALQAGLDQFRDSIQRKIARAALRKGMTVVNKAIKSEVPAGPMKDIKKFIGMRLLGRAAGEQIAGKVGVSVGKGAMGKKNKKDRAGRKGVGIGPNNVMWFILGTVQRFRGLRTIRDRKTGAFVEHRKTGNTVASTGAMPPQVPKIVQDGFNKSYTQALNAVIKATQEGIEREAAKLRAAVKAAM